MSNFDLEDLMNEVTDIRDIIGLLADLSCIGGADDEVQIKTDYLATTFGQLERKLVKIVDKGNAMVCSSSEPKPAELPTEEVFLLDKFRALNEQQRKIALNFLVGGCHFEPQT